MNIKQKLKLILGRITFFHSKSNFTDDYNKGFKHAIDLFSIAMEMEFGTWCEDQINLQYEIRNLEKELSERSHLVANQQICIKNLQRGIDKVPVFKLGKTQRNKLIGLLSNMTGLSYLEVRKHLNSNVKIQES